MHLFEKLLSSYTENIEFELKGFDSIQVLNFILNPRRLRGSDFLMRWSQGVWSEERLVQAVNDTKQFFAMPYGPSSTAPEDDVREFELYFERLEAAGLRSMKRPDLLLFSKTHQAVVENLVNKLGGVTELPFTPESNQLMQNVLSKAIIAIECENSLWKGRLMPDYGTELRPQKRLGGKMGLKKSAVLPTIIIKEEDREPLQVWQDQSGVPIHIWHVFYDVAYGLALDEAQKLIEEGYIQPTEQTFQHQEVQLQRKLFTNFTTTMGIL